MPSDAQNNGSTPSEAPRGPDRRKSVVDLRDTGLERRRGPGRRRSDFVKSAEEGELTPEQFLFVKAVDAYKRVNERPFPGWCEVLEVLRKLGYRKTLPSTLTLQNVADWTEAPDAEAFAGGLAEEELEEDLDAAA